MDSKHRKLDQWLTLAGSGVALLTGFLIPVYHYATPNPFTVQFHFQEITLPSNLLGVPTPKPLGRTQSSRPAEDLQRFLDNSSQILSLTIQNVGSASRHNVSVRLLSVMQLGGVGLKSAPSAIPGLESWLRPMSGEGGSLAGVYWEGPEQKAK